MYKIAYKLSMLCAIVHFKDLDWSVIITTCAHARSGVKQSVLSASSSVCLCHQNLGLITTTKGLNASKRHSNNDNSEKTVHGVPEGGYINPRCLWQWTNKIHAHLKPCFFLHCNWMYSGMLLLHLLVGTLALITRGDQQIQ